MLESTNFDLPQRDKVTLLFKLDVASRQLIAQGTTPLNSSTQLVTDIPGISTS